MKAWIDRPIEEAHLLNPAFCCVLIGCSAAGYTSVTPSGLPYPLAFLLAPIVLHKPTRESLPQRATTSLAAWLQEHADARINLVQHILALQPHVREALLFGCTHNWLVLDPTGHIRTTQSDTAVDRCIRALNNESKQCAQRARFLGKWFAAAGTPQTVMALWGVTL